MEQVSTLSSTSWRPYSSGFYPCNKRIVSSCMMMARYLWSSNSPPTPYDPGGLRESNVFHAALSAYFFSPLRASPTVLSMWLQTVKYTPRMVRVLSWLPDLTWAGAKTLTWWPKWTSTHQWTMKDEWYKWSGNSFLLGSSSLANHGGLFQLLSFYLPINNPQTKIVN